MLWYIMVSDNRRFDISLVFVFPLFASTIIAYRISFLFFFFDVMTVSITLSVLYNMIDKNKIHEFCVFTNAISFHLA